MKSKILAIIITLATTSGFAQDGTLAGSCIFKVNQEAVQVVPFAVSADVQLGLIGPLNVKDGDRVDTYTIMISNNLNTRGNIYIGLVYNEPICNPPVLGENKSTCQERDFTNILQGLADSKPAVNHQKLFINGGNQFLTVSCRAVLQFN